MNKTYWTMPDGRQSTIYALTDGKITAHISDFGATIHRLYVPDAKGQLALTFLLLAGIAAVAIYWVAVLL